MKKSIRNGMKHLAMWPITYPEKITVDARASPLDFKLLQKLSVLK
jgi:hypothetical protein